MDIDFSWLYLLIFILFPLSRIIPRLISRRRMKNNTGSQSFHQDPIKQEGIDSIPNQFKEIPNPQTKDMIVLGELNRGTKTFESIQKNTGFERKELNSILENLEKKGLMEVKQKQGLFGPKVELCSTEKGFKEFYS